MMSRIASHSMRQQRCRMVANQWLIVPRSDMAELPGLRGCPITIVVLSVKLQERSVNLLVVSAVTPRIARAAFEASDGG